MIRSIVEIPLKVPVGYQYCNYNEFCMETQEEIEIYCMLGGMITLQKPFYKYKYVEYVNRRFVERQVISFQPIDYNSMSQEMYGTNLKLFSPDVNKISHYENSYQFIDAINHIRSVCFGSYDKVTSVQDLFFNKLKRFEQYAQHIEIPEHDIYAKVGINNSALAMNLYLTVLGLGDSVSAFFELRNDLYYVCENIDELLNELRTDLPSTDLLTKSQVYGDKLPAPKTLRFLQDNPVLNPLAMYKPLTFKMPVNNVIVGNGYEFLDEALSELSNSCATDIRLYYDASDIPCYYPDPDTHIPPSRIMTYTSPYGNINPNNKPIFTAVGKYLMQEAGELDRSVYRGSEVIKTFNEEVFIRHFMYDGTIKESYHDLFLYNLINYSLILETMLHW